MIVVFSSNNSWSVYNFRLNLLSTLRNQGHELYIVAPQSSYLDKLKDLNYKTIPIAIDNSSKSIVSNFKLLFRYFRIYNSLKPDILMHNAVKPNIYGGLICRVLGIPTINNISGLGSLFMSNRFNSFFGKLLYRISQKKVQKVFFQNSADLNQFLEKKIVESSQCELLPGSGVDLNRFRPVEKYKEDEIVRFCFVGRLIGDKGIIEYIEAAKLIKKKYMNVEFYILGELYQENPTAISESKLNEWIESGIVSFLGKSDSVEKELNKFDCIVLPSYREGLSRVLLEASSMAIPSITSNVPGCIDVVEDGVNGFVCKVKDSVDLFLQMERFLKLTDSQRKEMGINGRLKVEKAFDERIVIQKYVEAINQIR